MGFQDYVWDSYVLRSLSSTRLVTSLYRRVIHGYDFKIMCETNMRKSYVDGISQLCVRQICTQAPVIYITSDFSAQGKSYTDGISSVRQLCTQAPVIYVTSDFSAQRRATWIWFQDNVWDKCVLRPLSSTWQVTSLHRGRATWMGFHNYVWDKYVLPHISSTWNDFSAQRKSYTDGISRLCARQLCTQALVIYMTSDFSAQRKSYTDGISQLCSRQLCTQAPGWSPVIVDWLREWSLISIDFREVVYSRHIAKSQNPIECPQRNTRLATEPTQLNLTLYTLIFVLFF